MEVANRFRLLRPSRWRSLVYRPGIGASVGGAQQALTSLFDDLIERGLEFVHERLCHLESRTPTKRTGLPQEARQTHSPSET